MISFEASDFEEARQPAGFRMQQLLLGCDDESRRILLEYLTSPNVSVKGLQRSLRAKLKDTEFHNIGAGAIKAWRDNEQYWMERL